MGAPLLNSLRFQLLATRKAKEAATSALPQAKHGRTSSLTFLGRPLFPVYFSETIVEVNVNHPIFLSDISVKIMNDDWHTKGTKRWLKRIDLDLDLNLKHVGFGCNKKQSLHFKHSTQMPKMQ